MLGAKGHPEGIYLALGGASHVVKRGRGSKVVVMRVGITDILDGLLPRAVGQSQSLDLRLCIAQLPLLICGAEEPEVRSSPVWEFGEPEEFERR